MITHPLAHLLYAVGSLIFGIATFHAGVLPRGGAPLAALGQIWLLAMFMAGFGESGSFLLLLAPVAATALGLGLDRLRAPCQEARSLSRPDRG